MFSDLQSTQFKCSRVKAYPSVNGVNDGNFNSESNLRWLSKKITNKPYIVGQEEADVLDSICDAGGVSSSTTINIKSGLVSADGYLFKFANNPDFDDTTQSVISLDTKPIQKFISDITHYNTSNELAQEMSKFLYSDMVPDGTNTSAVLAKWTSAYTSKTEIGYIGTLCDGDAYTKLTHTYPPDSPEHRIWYNDKYIEVLDLDSPIDLTTSPDDIKNNLPDGFNLGDAFAVNNTSSSILIFYPVYFTDNEKYNKEEKDYIKIQPMMYTDIFGMVNEFTTRISHTKVYPYTQSPFIDMGNNAPLTPFTSLSCQRYTLPNNIYDFDALYSEGYTTPTNMTSPRYPAGTILSNYVQSVTMSTVLSRVFDVYTVDNLKTLIPSSVTQMEVNNTLFYYCIKGIEDSNKLTIDGNSNKKVPVAFLMSNGQLCTEGFVSSLGTTQYPVESYVHFIKRMFLTNPTPPSESEIEQLTVEEMCSTDRARLTTLFNNYLAKSVFAYLHLSYCSLMEYGIVDVLTQTTHTDADLIKSIGCGVSLADQPGTTTDDYNTSFGYNYTGYSLQVGELTPTTKYTFLTFAKDSTSDHYKIQNFDGTGKITSTKPSVTYSLVAPLEVSGNYTVALYVEDPISWVKENNIAYGSNTPYIGVTTPINVYKLTSGAQGVIKSTRYLENVETPGTLSRLYLDEYLLPLAPKNCTIYNDSDVCLFTRPVKLSGNNYSIKDGLSITWYSNKWTAYVPEYMLLDKDGLGYLAGRDRDDVTMYNGIEVLPSLDEVENGAFLFNNAVNTAKTVIGYNECNEIEVDTTSKMSKRKREAFIHASKVYGENYETIEDMIRRIADFDESALDELNQAVGIPYNNDDSLSERVTEIERIIEIPYTNEDSISDRLDTLENANNDFEERIQELETAVGVPYDEVEKGTISDRLDLIESTMLDMTTTLVIVAMGTRTATSTTTKLYVRVQDYGVTDLIPAETTLICRIPFTKNLRGFGTLGNTSFGQMLQLGRDNGALPYLAQGYITPNNVDFYYSLSIPNILDANDKYTNQNVLMMYVRNNNASDFHFEGVYSLKVQGALRDKPSGDLDLFVTDDITVELIANADLPMKDTTYYINT